MKLAILVLVPLNVLAGLALEAYGAARGWSWAEPLVGLVTAAHLAFYMVWPPEIAGQRVSRLTLVACLLLATGGELILSAVWGLYLYRASLLPLFVPPGHVLLFLTGVVIATDSRCTHRVSGLVPAVAAVPLAYVVVNGADYLSIPLFTIFLACLAFGRDPKLYAVMFVLALGLELYGTALGAWTWTPEIGSWRLPSANPPLAAGVFYALLDLLTMRLATRPPETAAEPA